MALYGQTHKYSITICYSRFLASSRCQCRHSGAANRLYRHPLECFNGDGASCSETYIINLVFRSKRTQLTQRSHGLAPAIECKCRDSERWGWFAYKLNRLTTVPSQTLFYRFIKYSNLCIHAHLVNSRRLGSAFGVCLANARTHTRSWIQSEKCVCGEFEPSLIYYYYYREPKMVCTHTYTKFPSTTYLHNISYGRVWVNNSTIYPRERTHTHTRTQSMDGHPHKTIITTSYEWQSLLVIEPRQRQRKTPTNACMVHENYSYSCTV